MRAQICLLDHLIRMWDTKQWYFQAGTHIITLDVEDIYFLTILLRRGPPISLSGPKGCDVTTKSLSQQFCTIGTQIVGGKIPINMYQMAL